MMCHSRPVLWMGRWQVLCALTIKLTESPLVVTQISLKTLFGANGALMGELYNSHVVANTPY